jgi:hypothetical protein
MAVIVCLVSLLVFTVVSGLLLRYFQKKEEEETKDA